MIDGFILVFAMTVKGVDDEGKFYVTIQCASAINQMGVSLNILEAMESDLPNTATGLVPLAVAGRLPLSRAWFMLALRPVASLAMLLAVSAVYALRGAEMPFAKSAAWWLWFVTLTNLLSIFFMQRLGRLEGLRLRDIYYVRRSSWKRDLVWFLVSMVVIAIVAQLPGNLLGRLFWGGSSVPNNMLFGPLPLIAIYPLFLLMPLSHAFSELPLYWGYVAPRLRARGMGRWATILVVGFVLSFQHLCFSFQPDWRYAIWLAIKFLPFAIWTGFVVDRRPSVLPWLMAGHFLLDASLPVLALLVSKGLTL